MDNTIAMALVEDTEDEEGRGRVQVSYPWLPDIRENPWAPVASPLAGSERGLFFMPEQGDEVLVAFEQGDFDHPIIIGYMWNGNAQAPEDDPQNRIILTPGGHTLRFEDGDDKKIIVRTNGGHELLLDDSSGSKGVTLKTSGGHNIKCNDAAGSQGIELKTNGNLTITLSDTNTSIELNGGGRTLTMIGGMLKVG